MKEDFIIDNNGPSVAGMDMNTSYVNCTAKILGMPGGYDNKGVVILIGEGKFVPINAYIKKGIQNANGRTMGDQNNDGASQLVGTAKGYVA